MSKILIIGDIMGRPGRHAIVQVLPGWRQKFQPEVVIANIENLTHGKGISEAHVQTLIDLGVDAFTSGNHVFDTGPLAVDCFNKFPQVVRPANFKSLSKDEVSTPPGSGYYRFNKNDQQYLLMNFCGQVFFEKQFRGEIVNPFFSFDEIYNSEAQKDDIILVDLHAEATSEKNAFGNYLDGRASIIYGTHTHIPTADTKFLPRGSLYQTDLGMTGIKNSVLGVDVKNSLDVFLGRGKFKMQIPESGTVVANALLIETEANRIKSFVRLQQEVEV